MKEKIIRIFKCGCRREDCVFKSAANHRPVCPEHHELQLSKIRTCFICGKTEEVSNYVNQKKFHCSKCWYSAKLKKTAEGNKKRERQSIGKKVEGDEVVHETPLRKFLKHLDRKYRLPPVVVSADLRRIANG